MVREVLDMDIGIFPLFDVEDSRVRGFLKALIYMSGGAAVVASPMGAVPQLIADGVNGLLASTRHQWIQALDRLVSNPALRRNLADSGLKTARYDYSFENSFRALCTALDV